jgi:haloalkane dehalogenase
MRSLCFLSTCLSVAVLCAAASAVGAADQEGKLASAVLKVAPLPACVGDDSRVPRHKTPAGLEFVRTPDERFAGLNGYAFAPHYVELDGLRMHYVEEGPAGGQVVLLLHGQPTWSYLYRKMIPPLAAAGYRVIALDLIGTGQSDKPVDLHVHTYEQHVAWIKAFLRTKELKDITLFCQDWGSLMGLRVVGDEPERFARVVVANGTLPVFPAGTNPFRVPNPVTVNCDLGPFAKVVPPAQLGGRVVGFNRWIAFCLTTPNFIPSDVVGFLTVRPLTKQQTAGYDAPYPSFIYKAAPRAFPSMIAAIETNNEKAWATLGKFDKPFLSLAGEKDLLLGTKEMQDRLTNHIPGARGQPHERFKDAGHFIQEDIGETLADRVHAFIKANPRR